MSRLAACPLEQAAGLGLPSLLLRPMCLKSGYTKYCRVAFNFSDTGQRAERSDSGQGGRRGCFPQHPRPRPARTHERNRRGRPVFGGFPPKSPRHRPATHEHGTAGRAARGGFPPKAPDAARPARTTDDSKLQFPKLHFILGIFFTYICGLFSLSFVVCFLFCLWFVTFDGRGGCGRTSGPDAGDGR